MGKLKEEAFARLKELSRLKLSKRGAAKILYNEGYFTSIEAARSSVRGHTGAKGRYAKNNIQWLTDVPTAIEGEFAYYDLPKDTDGIGLLCDIHLPFQDEKTIHSFLERKDEYEVIVLQEVFDFVSLSKFAKFRTIDIAKEQESFWQLMEFIRDKCPDHRIIFQRGNHDERMQTFIMRKAQELENLQGMEFETLFALDDFGVELLPFRNILRYRGLYIGHGHELNVRSGGVLPAKTFYNKTGGNFIGGHLHTTSEYITSIIGDDVKGCWSVGCASDLHPNWLPINGWNHGYAVIRPHGEDNFRVKNIKLF